MLSAVNSILRFDDSSQYSPKSVHTRFRLAGNIQTIKQAIEIRSESEISELKFILTIRFSPELLD